MVNRPQYVLVSPAAKSAGIIGQTIKLSLAAVLVLFLAFSAYLTWRWADQNLLHWGINDSKTTRVSEAGLLERLQVFQVVSIKDRYSVRSAVNVDKALSAGPARVSLPGWVAGQDMHTSGEVMVSAGVDLTGLRPEDIEIQRDGQGTHVIIRVPEPVILSTELVPNTMNIETSQGVLTRLKTRLGFSEKDLRDQAADGLAKSASDEAVSAGLLATSGQAVKSRLSELFASLPHGNETVIYEIEFRPRPLS